MNCDNTPMFDGDAEALFSVGRRFLTGNGVDKDEAKGRQMISEAAACLGGEQISDAHIADVIASHFDLRPAAITKRFGLKNPIFQSTAAYGHVGRKPYKAPVKLLRGGVETTEDVQFFAWELLDEVDALKKAAFGL